MEGLPQRSRAKGLLGPATPSPRRPLALGKARSRHSIWSYQHSPALAAEPQPSSPNQRPPPSLRLLPPPGFKAVALLLDSAGCGACGTTRMKTTAGYAEACALPSLAASSILDKNKEWHANVPTKWVKRRAKRATFIIIH